METKEALTFVRETLGSINDAQRKRVAKELAEIATDRIKIVRTVGEAAMFRIAQAGSDASVCAVAAYMIDTGVIKPEELRSMVA